MTHGRKIYATKALIDEIDTIKKRKNLKKESEAKFHLVKYAQVGREVERLSSFFGMGKRRRK